VEYDYALTLLLAGKLTLSQRSARAIWCIHLLLCIQQQHVNRF
jgi:hypothetical protein